MKGRITTLKEEQIYLEGKLEAYEHSLKTLKKSDWKNDQFIRGIAKEIEE